jgi:mono/diheme cytochrome c family protein
MTKPQIWVATVLVVFILLFLLSRLTKEEETGRTSPVGSPIPQTDMTSEDLSGMDLIVKINCTTCHGNDLTGTRMGPSLYNVSEFWSRERLINYLRNPASFADTDRLKRYKEEYPGIFMPAYSQIEVKDLGKIADFLLELK